ncbi:transcriptional regulator, LysR family protein [Plesiocystis pacifica SIR-1]|uniref:Transcriptional regulator, LysR family protein n=1 Tax=Plesiocystis pacifica SIR-1 TaxID=391625 RepID=A6FY23_9BACT|nr:LysR family transcriptional regulator [Plesiocystis pacifica]EDM81402.1 transcriptional regulator, LysR family protein [Plesiocystis pacifica SIR-1]
MSTPLDASDLAALAALDALLQTSSVTGAARRLGLSTPAVSHALARLRERFGDPLLVRAGRGMVLTPRAEQLRPRVRDALSLATLVFEDPGAFEPASMERSFTLSMTDYVLRVFGGPFEARVRAAAPGVDLRVIVNAVDDAERLRAGDTDLVVGIYGALPPELRTRAIISERLVCVVREAHPVLAPTKRRLTLRQFVTLEHVQIAPRGQPGGYVDDRLAELGHARRVARAVPFFQLALEMTASSDYLLTVSERIARQLGPELGLRVLEPPSELGLEPYALSMVWHPRFDADAGHRWLREQLVESTQALDGLSHARPRRRLDASDPTAGEASGRRRRKAKN